MTFLNCPINHTEIQRPKAEQRQSEKNSPQLKAHQHQQATPENDNDQCKWHYPYHIVPSAITSRDVACTNTSATPASATTPVGSPKKVPLSPSSSHLGATAYNSHGSPGTPTTSTSFRSNTPTPQPLTPFIETPSHSQSLPSSPVTPPSVRSKPWFLEATDNATRNLHSIEAAATSPAPPS